MKRTLPYFGITAFLFLGGCDPGIDNTPIDLSCELDSPCGAGTVCVDLGETLSCVEEDCNTTANPNFCEAGTTCNNATGECDAVVIQQFCTSLDGSQSVEPASADVTIAGSIEVIAPLSVSQVSNAGDGADTVFQLNISEKSDLLVRTLPGITAPDTVLVLRKGDCNTGVDVLTIDDVNIDNGQSAILNARNLEPDNYFLFVDSKTTDPITEVSLEISRTKVLAVGAGCSIGSSVQRCDLGACVSPDFNPNGETFPACVALDIPGRFFVLTDLGLAELEPGTGEVLNSADFPFQLSGTAHYALAYDDVNQKLFAHDSFSTQIDDPDGDGIGPDVKSEVLIFDANTLDRVGEWPIPAGIQIEALGFNRAGDANQQIAAFDALQNKVNVLSGEGVFSFNYGLNNNNATLIAGLGVDGNSIEQTNTRGYVTKSDVNQVQEFVLGVGSFLRTVGAPPLTGLQCSLGVHGDFAFVGYDVGLVRVVTAVDNVVPGAPAGSFVTEYFAPSLNACGGDAGL